MEDWQRQLAEDWAHAARDAVGIAVCMTIVYGALWVCFGA